MLHHQFVVVKSKSQYFSYEKNMKGICVQVSQNEEDVRIYLRMKKYAKSNCLQDG